MSEVPPARVLVVDDEPFVRKIAERVLARDGHVVVGAPDGKAALVALAEQDFALVLLDASLPDMNAERLLELMRERGFDTPVLLSSGFGADALPTAADFANVRGFLGKPYAVAALSSKVRELLGG